MSTTSTTVQTVGLFEAKAHLSELVARAEAGGEVIITRHHKPVARLVPIAADPSADGLARRREALARIAGLRDELARQGVRPSRDEIVDSVRELRDEQTRRKSPW